MKKLAIVIVLAILAGGAWVFLHPKEAAKMEQNTEQAASRAADNPEQAAADAASAAKAVAIKAELEAVRLKMQTLNLWINACKNHSAPTKLDGAYDGFSYDKGDTYQQQEQEQEQRYKDLQDRLSKVYGK